MIPVYNDLVQSIRVLIYSGDVDTCVNYIGTERAARKIQAGGPKSEWTAWFVNDQVAGYFLRLGDNLTYKTIKLAGHMVPSTRPAEALAMLQDFIFDL